MEGVLHVYHQKKSLLLFEFTSKSTIPRIDSTSVSSSSTSPSSIPQNTLLFVGGLYDNFLNPGYTADLARLFPRNPTQAWRVMHVQLSSHGNSFGISDVNNDIDEIAIAISYIRNNLSHHPKSHPPNPSSSSPSSTIGSNIILMGHSTGCQDVLNYLSNPSNPTRLTSNNPSSSPPQRTSTTTRPQIQGAIFQAPCSDRDSLLHSIETDATLKSTYLTIQSQIQSTPPQNHRSTMLPTHLTFPLFGPAPISISRFVSLSSPNSPSNPSEEDFFSSDLTDQSIQHTFGNISKQNLLKSPPHSVPVSSSSTNNDYNDDHDNNTTSRGKDRGNGEILILMSGKDEYVPSHIDKQALMGRWTEIMHNHNTNTNTKIQSSPSPSSSSNITQTEREGSGEPVVTMSRHNTIIPNANHAVDGDDLQSRTARLWVLRRTVLMYLDDVVGSVDQVAWDILEKERREFGIDTDGGDADHVHRKNDDGGSGGRGSVKL